jgi:hypothetical protein
MSLSRRSFLTLVVLLAIPACAREHPDPEAAAVTLVMDAIPLQVFGISAEPRGDTMLQLPAYLRFDRQGWVFTLETARPSAVGFRIGSGSSRVVGRPGRGPGEMAGPMSIDVSPSGRIWVADQGNAKMVGYEDGKAWGEFRVDHPPMGVAAVGDSEVWVGGDLRHSVMVRYDVHGRRLGTAGVPPDTTALGFRLNQGSAARGTGPCAVVWVYRFHSRVECFGRNGETVWTASGPVRIGPDKRTDPFRMHERDRFAYTDVAVHGNRVYALFVGGPAGSYALRTDRAQVFAIEDGRFLGTLQLPHRSKALMRSDSLLGLLESEPEPHILLYRIQGER